jgi:DNA-binding winged helix-turn-helix (wHTH) protein/TolB-like protein
MRIVPFGEFEFDTHTYELRRGGAAVKLQQQPARVLAVLIEHSGDLVSRETLRLEIWGEETFVDFDRGLNYCISQIRAAFGETADAPRFLETLRGRGYRFVPPEALAEIVIPPRARTSRGGLLSLPMAMVLLLLLGAAGIMQALANRRPAIGVMPFAAAADARPWSQSLHVQLVSRLALVTRLPVIDLQARPTSVPWRLDGRIDRTADHYRVIVSLKSTSDGSVRWADIFDGPLSGSRASDWIDAQNEMADDITHALRYEMEGPSAPLPMKRAMRRRSPYPLRSAK